MSDDRPWWRKPENLLSLVAYLGATAAFVVGLTEYQNEQRWRRLELVATRISEYSADPAFRNARLILEYPRPTVCLFGGEPVDPDARCTEVGDSLLTSALRTSIADPRLLSPEEMRIIQVLDEYLNALERLDFLLEQGFLGEEVRHPTVNYWISLVGNRDWLARPPEVQAVLCDYLSRFEYTGTRDLMMLYVPPEDVACSGPFFRHPDHHPD